MRAIIIGVCVALAFTGNAGGQNSQPAGGKWTVQDNHDKMTDAVSRQFNLMADITLNDGIVIARPALAVVCRSGHFQEAEFQTGIVLAVPITENRGLLAIPHPAHYIRARTDGKMRFFTWDQLDDGKTMQVGKHDLEKLLDARDLRIEFASYGGYQQVAQFSPSGLDKVMFGTACKMR